MVFRCLLNVFVCCCMFVADFVRLVCFRVCLWWLEYFDIVLLGVFVLFGICLRCRLVVDDWCLLFSFVGNSVVYSLFIICLCYYCLFVVVVVWWLVWLFYFLLVCCGYCLWFVSWCLVVVSVSCVCAVGVALFTVCVYVCLYRCVLRDCCLVCVVFVGCIIIVLCIYGVHLIYFVCLFICLLWFLVGVYLLRVKLFWRFDCLVVFAGYAWLLLVVFVFVLIWVGCWCCYVWFTLAGVCLWLVRVVCCLAIGCLVMW